MVFGGLVPEVDDEEDPTAEKEALSEDGLRTEVSAQVLEVDVSTGAVEVKEALPEGQFFFPGTYSFIHSEQLYTLGFGKSARSLTVATKYEHKVGTIYSLAEQKWSLNERKAQLSAAEDL
mmetsp:Transcript_23826/g.21166  ORF Transcript_23826/g.21166 Transcript_23826/m.21166 type:complete len:120 (+) Transcript_23826:175-534(+)